MKKTEKIYNRIARDYEEAVAKKNYQYEKLFVKNIPKNRGAVLEIGSGTGIVVANLARYFKRAVGTDIALKMDAIAATEQKKCKNCEFYRMAAEKLDFRDETFDYVVSFTTLHHTNYTKSLSEIARVTKKGGRVFIIDCFRTTNILTRFIHYLQLTWDRLKLGPVNMVKNLRFEWGNKEWREHLRKDRYLCGEEYQETYGKYFPGCEIKKTGYFRGVIWDKK